MNKASVAEAPATSGVDYDAEIDRYLAAMEQMRGSLAESQKNIEQLRAETRAMLSEINTTLDKWASA